ncbi:hypothetical protein CDAR_28261 [Caerostris darwini]|uniref:Uncharacterized protein n=1 Tax=Caerostris darwini TaxID=1538125 RepID=A0AAV4UR97_9ARAC|nr:hypothetical protein CDAR_28261 [Caerostris darwini]
MTNSDNDHRTKAESLNSTSLNSRSSRENSLHLISQASTNPDINKDFTDLGSTDSNSTNKLCEQKIPLQLTPDGAVTVTELMDSDSTGLKKNESLNSSGDDSMSDWSTEELNNSGIQSDEEIESKRPKSTKLINPVELSPAAYKNAILSIDMARFCLLRTTYIAMKQLESNAKEANEHMNAVRNLVIKELLQLNVHPKLLAKDMFNLIKEIFICHYYLNKKVVDCQKQRLFAIINTLNDDLKATEILNEPKYVKQKSEIRQRSVIKLLFDNLPLIFFVCIVTLVLWLGINSHL